MTYQFLPFTVTIQLPTTAFRVWGFPCSEVKLRKREIFLGGILSSEVLSRESADQMACWGAEFVCVGGGCQVREFQTKQYNENVGVERRVAWVEIN